MSKTGNLYFTNQQYEIASAVSPLDYAIQHYDLKAIGDCYKMRDHDSLVFRNGLFFWNSRELIGNAIKFIKAYEQRSTVEAVLILAGELDRNTGRLIAGYVPSSPATAKTVKLPKAVFIPPARDNIHKRVFAYLVKARGIRPQLVSDLMKQKKVYQTYVEYNGKRIINAAFVLECEELGITGAILRGITDNNNFKSVYKGSDREHGYFYYRGAGPDDTVCVFESPIDAMSYDTLLTMQNRDGEHPGYYFARGGTGDKNVFQFLREHPEVKKVISCDDNDPAGNLFADSLFVKLKVMGYEVRRQAPELKDYNKVLKRKLGINEETEKGESA